MRLLVEEKNFIKFLIKSDGRLPQFFERLIAGLLGVVTVAIWPPPPVFLLWRRWRHGAR